MSENSAGEKSKVGGLQNKYYELQLVQHQLQQVQKQISALESQASEMDLVLEVLDDFSRAKPKSDAFVTLTPGLFVKARLEESDKVILNVGAGAAVEKSVADAKKVVSQQGLELRKLQEELMGQMHKLASHAEKVQEDLRVLVKG